MKSPEQYIPTPEETKKAEDSMSDSQKEQSEKREKNWEYQVKRKLGELEYITERYKTEFKTLEFADNAPEDIKHEILYVKGGLSGSVPKLSFVGLYPFQEKRHWGSGIDADGVLRDDLNLSDYTEPENKGGLYGDLWFPIAKTFEKARPAIEKLANDFNEARKEIAKDAGVTLPEDEIPYEGPNYVSQYDSFGKAEMRKKREEYEKNNPGRLTYWNENSIKFYEAQWDKKNRHLIKKVVDDLEEILKTVKEN